jgi:hypothetical protein
MNPQPTLSVIVPAYNVARYIEPCIGAILQQLAPHHALIVIDDGSTDATPALLDAMLREHGAPNFTLIRQHNQGIAATRNRGLAAATGDYIVFVDGDDLLRPGSLAALDQVIAQHRPEAIACDFSMWRPDKPAKTRMVSPGHVPGVVLRDRDAILRTFFADRHMYVWAYVIRRAAYQRLPQPVFPQDRMFEDVSVLSRLLSECDSLYHLPHATIDYRQHAASITKVISHQWCLDFAAALQQVAACFREPAVSDELRMAIDVTACHFYIGIVKNSYQLPWSVGRAARTAVKSLFLDSLFNPPDVVLAAMRRRSHGAPERHGDARAARQASQALAGSLMFDIGKAASRKVKFWQRLGKAKVPA